MEISQETLDFIGRHANDDVRLLALQANKQSGIDLTFALNQIAGRQKARLKIPSWAATDGIDYPPHLNMEQCSSEATARYKASILQAAPCTTFADLTGGLGVDFSFMARGSGRAFYVEQNSDLCQLAAHNMPLLGLNNVEIANTDAEEFLNRCEPLDVLFADPARRDSHGGRTYGIADCTPDVLRLMPLMATKARRIVLKLSPMLDWQKAVADIHAAAAERACVTAVHIVAVANECKELLLDISTQPLTVKEKPATHPTTLAEEERPFTAPCCIVCVNLLPDGTMEQFVSEAMPKATSTEKKQAGRTCSFDNLSEAVFLYEPNAAIMKAGCFDQLTEVFGILPISANSHLFVSSDFIGNFPGRRFRINTVSSLNKRDLRTALSGLSQANITVRNFPLSVAELRKRLRLKDGGSVYIFATTAANNNHLLLICEKNNSR